MSSKSSLSEADFRCPVCYEVFRDPVVLSCSHSLCRECLRRWWRERAGANECPLCRAVQRSSPPRNLAVRKLCVILVRGQHGERTTLGEGLRRRWAAMQEKLRAKLGALRRDGRGEWPGGSGVPPRRRSLRERLGRLVWFYKQKRRTGRFAAERYAEF